MKGSDFIKVGITKEIRTFGFSAPYLRQRRCNVQFRLACHWRIVNSGHTRANANVVRTTGDDFDPKRFSTWCPKALAGIDKLADTIMDRAIPLELRRKKPTETVQKLRYDERFTDVVSMLAKFADDNRENIRNARPRIPSKLNDRMQDNCEPLLAIAEIAGNDMAKLARSHF